MHGNECTARAHANIALIKYWGKRDQERNIPAVGSISMTLDALHTTTTLRFDESLSQDRLILNEEEATANQLNRVTSFLDLVRDRADLSIRAHIRSVNNFPTGAGLASSASGFAALTLAATGAAGLDLNREELSALARRGSGSAARSIFGGFVEMFPEKQIAAADSKEEQTDAFAVQLYDESYWDIRLLVLILSEEEKTYSSREGMTISADTSPYYNAWMETSPQDLAEMRDALQIRNFEKTGELSEYSCLKMHALTMSSRPGILYWQPGTLSVIHAVRDLRSQGIPAYFTIDAGPQVKVLCLPEQQEQIITALRDIPDVLEIIPAQPGPDAKIREDAP
ncbi:MAG TPA: diphosphomevalonate decarboxylase [bacterium]|nr:diphosphomevalonate decarboxylase [bacterium]